MKTPTAPRSGPLARAWLLCLAALVVAGAVVPGAASPALAQGAPPVRYDPIARAVYVGADYGPGSPFAGFPSHPDAPKAAISVPALDAALAGLGQPDLIVDQGGGAWLIKSDVVISPTARLEATSATISSLRLDSTPDRFPALTRLVADGGHLLIQGISVVSWDTRTGAVDAEHLDGRSYLLAQNGARMDIVDAEVAYLGWAAGEPSGLAWRKRGAEGDPKTGATGSIVRSNIHHNYFGQYSYEAYGLQVLNNEFHHNLFYGFDPHDFSINFVVAYNKVYNNGKHGIIFSRGCEWNWIHNNEVYGNAEHGIMLDRGSNNNKISDNLVYNNRDGIAIFQSSNNLIQNNTLRDNERGVRINASYDPNDIYDGLATDNTVLGNTIENNAQYGVYLYERADRNTIARNKIAGTGASGVYVRSGANTIEHNVIRDNGHGVTIIGGAYTAPPPGGPAYVAPVSQPGLKNNLFANTIEDNAGNGVQVRTGIDTMIGPRDPEQRPELGNQIRTNGSEGILLSEGAAESLIQGNTIHANSRDGVEARGATTARNLISRNSITANGGLGINLREGAQGGILAPTITSALDATTVAGTAAPNATVEIYRDPGGQGNVFKGRVTAASDGSWSFALPAGDDPRQGAISVLAIASNGNTSAFFTNAPVTTRATYTVSAGRNGELTVFIGGEGASVTLPDIQAALQVISPTVTLLESQGGGVWQANASLFLSRGVTLTVAAPAVTWLKLRSQAADIALAAEAGPYNYHSFTTLRTHSGAILIDGVRITSWDPAANTYDLDVANGRSYLLAKYDARMDIRNATISYLGSADGESYGVSWRDTNDAEAPDVLQTRVTGEVVNSVFSHNYFGVYTYQASDMLFRGNKFHNNIGYGFDPHDFSSNFLVENNEAFENGNHGFIISRGCTNFVFRNNKSYNNRYTADDQDRNAHGFMIDPGSPNSRYPQIPSSDNLLEGNEAWGNDGYGLRILGSNTNTIKNNTFRDNAKGVTLERGSAGNVLDGNTITGNAEHGVFLFGGADGNTLTGNTVAQNGLHGIYIKTGGNTVAGNAVTNNGAGAEGSGIAFLPDTPATAIADLTASGMAASDPEVLSAADLATALAGNRIVDNTIAGNADDGIDLKGAAASTVTGNRISDNGVHGVFLSAYNGLGATGNNVSGNTVVRNGGHGIRANGAESSGNVWSQNSVSGNTAGGIRNFSGANGAVTPPRIAVQSATSVSGTATPGAKVEIFSDDGGQGMFYEGQTTAAADGAFSFSKSGGWRGRYVNVTATDGGGNSTGFANDRPLVRIYLPLARR
jgi:parallel beta-helix repeat protein